MSETVPQRFWREERARLAARYGEYRVAEFESVLADTVLVTFPPESSYRIAALQCMLCAWQIGGDDRERRLPPGFLTLKMLTVFAAAGPGGLTTAEVVAVMGAGTTLIEAGSFMVHCERRGWARRADPAVSNPAHPDLVWRLTASGRRAVTA
jgi:hypothetical protein